MARALAATSAAVSRDPATRWRGDLLANLVRRNLKLIYKRPALGVLWALIVPLMQLLVFYWLFDLLFAGTAPNYASFLFIGLVTWSWFSGSLGQGTVSIVNNRSLLRQPGFPVAVLPAVVLLSTLFEFLVAVPVLFIFLAVGKVNLGPWALLMPALMALQGLLAISLIYPLAAFNVRFRDTQHMVAVGLHAMFFLSAVFYDIQRIPEVPRTILLLNPMLHLVAAYRAILIDGEAPAFGPLAAILLLSLLALPLGVSAFRRNSVRFVEEL
jgi:lipopolysaccharide transport system permease protein